MELMTAVGASGLVILVVVTIAMYVYIQHEQTKSRLEAETSANRLEYLFKLYLSQAVNITGTIGLDEASANFNLADANGAGRWFGPPNTTTPPSPSIVWDQMSDLAGNWATLGVFIREMGMGTDSDLRSAAIWYRKPTPNTSGVVFFDVGNDTNTPMVPDYGDNYVSGITRLEFQRRDVGAPAQLSALRINFTLRYQKRTDAGVNWCPQADIDNAVAGCVTPGVLYNEISRNFEVVLRNNFRSINGVNGTLGEVRTLGRLYFFQILNPARWNLP